MEPATAGQQVGMRDQHLGAAVGEDVGDLVGLEMPVDRHGVGAEAHGGQRGLQKSEVVAQQQRDAVALAHAERREAGGGAQDACVEGGSGQAAVAADERWRKVERGAGAVVMCG